MPSLPLTASVLESRSPYRSLPHAPQRTYRTSQSLQNMIRETLKLTLAALAACSARTTHLPRYGPYTHDGPARRHARSLETHAAQTSQKTALTDSWPTCRPVGEARGMAESRSLP